LYHDFIDGASSAYQVMKGPFLSSPHLEELLCLNNTRFAPKVKQVLVETLTTLVKAEVALVSKNECSLETEGLDGIEYEYAVADLINSHIDGWAAEVSKASGDQGLDVMARSKSCSVAIQTKLYNQPVGNKAVQEIIAAKGFYNADHAAVVTNASFTKSAVELADSQGVALLHHNELLTYFGAIDLENKMITREELKQSIESI